MAESIDKPLTWVQHIKLLRFIMKLIYRQHKLYTLFFTSTLIITALMPAASIWVGKLILDEVALLLQSQGATHHLLMLIALEVFLLLTQSLLSQLTSYLSARFASLFQLGLTAQLLDNNVNIDYHHFEQPEFYNKFNIASQHVVQSASSYLNILTNVLRSFVQLISISALLLMIDIWFLVAILVVNLINFYVSMQMVKRQYNLVSKTVQRTRMIDYLYHLLTELKTIRDIKLNNLYPGLIKRYVSKSHKNIDLNLTLQRREIKIMSGLQALSTLVYYGFYVYIIMQVVAKILSLGDILLFQRSYTTLSGALSAISSSFTQIYEKNLYLQQFYDLLHNGSYHDQGDINLTNAVIDRIELTNLQFAYPARLDKWIIRRCHLHIQRGDCVAIVGKNGVGKSTLAKLICGLFMPTVGDIKVNNYKITDINKDNYYKNLSVILQDWNHYDLSLYDNITCMAETVDQNRLGDVIELCQLQPIIERLDEGLDTVLSRQFQDGESLSAGQWQKIALARALYRQSDVLILDEPTAQLDAVYSHYFFNLLPVLQQRIPIIIVVTHKLTYLEQFNKIIYINDDGEVAMDSHSALKQNNPHYLQLVS